MLPDHPHGVFYDDIRIVSKWEFSVDNQALEPLTVIVHDQPYQAVFLARARRGGRTSNTIFVERERRVGTGMREDITLRNMGREPAACTVTLVVDADFADLFEVKEGEPRNDGHYVFRSEGTRIIVERWWRGMQRGVIIQADDATSVAHDRITFRAVVPARGQWSTTVLVRPVVDGEDLRPRSPNEQPVDAVRRRPAGCGNGRANPVVSTDTTRCRGPASQPGGPRRAAASSIPAPGPGRVVAAGRPWFMTLFGRDSLLDRLHGAAARPVTRARHPADAGRPAGRRGGPAAPRSSPAGSCTRSASGTERGLGARRRHASTTARPTRRRCSSCSSASCTGGAPRADDRPTLLPAADRALDWIERYGDRDGDGFVEYQRRHRPAGWSTRAGRTRSTAINFADGRIAEAADRAVRGAGLRLCRVPGRAPASPHEPATSDAGRRRWADRAAALEAGVQRALLAPGPRLLRPRRSTRDKRPVDALASNMGHCLWTGIVDEDKAAAVADRLLSARRCSPAGASAPWPRRWAPTTR